MTTLFSSNMLNKVKCTEKEHNFSCLFRLRFDRPDIVFVRQMIKEVNVLHQAI